MSLIAQKTFNTTVINFIGIAIGAISVLFFQTEFLTEKEIGTIRILIDVSLFVSTLIVFGTNNAITKYYHRFNLNKSSNDSFLTFVFVIPFIIMLLAGFLYLLTQDYWTDILLQKQSTITNYILAIPILVFSHVTYSLFEAYLSTKAKIIYPAFLKGIFLRIVFIVLILLLHFNFISFFQLVYIHSFTFTLNSVLLFLSVRKHIEYSFTPNFNFKLPVFREIFTFCTYIFIGTGGGVFVKFIDTLMIGGMLQDIGKVGVYSIAFYLAALVEVPKRPLTGITVPMISKALNNNEIDKVDSLYKKSSINLMIFGGFVFVLIWLNIDSIFQLLPNGESYLEGKYVVFFIGLSKVFDLSVGLNYEIIHNSKYYKWNLVLMPFLALISITLNYAFIKMYGIVGTAIATAISIFIFNLIRTLLVRYKLLLNPFSYKHIIVLLIIGIPIVLKELGGIPYINNPYFSIVIVSICSTIFFSSIYFMRISKDLNSFIDNFLLSYFKKNS